GIDRHRAAKARADHADPVGVNGVMFGKERQRAAEIFNLLEADDAAELAFALAASAHVETQRHVAQRIEHSRWIDDAFGIAIATEAMQHEKTCPAVAGPQARWNTQCAVKPTARGREGNSFFVHG